MKCRTDSFTLTFLMLAVEVNFKLGSRRTQSFETPKFSPLVEHARRVGDALFIIDTK